MALIITVVHHLHVTSLYVLASTDTPWSNEMVLITHINIPLLLNCPPKGSRKVLLHPPRVFCLSVSVSKITQNVILMKLSGNVDTGPSNKTIGRIHTKLG